MLSDLRPTAYPCNYKIINLRLALRAQQNRPPPPGGQVNPYTAPCEYSLAKRHGTLAPRSSH